MDYRLVVLQRSVAILVLAVNLFALGACSNSTNGPMTPTALRKGGGASAATTGYLTVDAPCSGTGPCANEITGINDSDDVVGNYSNCTSKSSNPCNAAHWSCNPTTAGPCEPCPLLGGANVWHSYTSQYVSGGYSTFSSVQFPDAPNGQYMNAISDRIAGIGAPIQLGTNQNTVEVGCINTFAGVSGEENGVWGLIDNNELWSVHDKGGSTGCDYGMHNRFFGTGELLGYDSTNTISKTAVGFRNDPKNSCTFVATEIQAGSGKDTNWQNLTVFPPSFPAINVMATGITESSATSSSGDIVGIVTKKSASPSQQGWYLPNTTSAETYFYPGSTATAFTGIAKVAGTLEIVGWYTLPANGTATASTHGLVATPGTTGFTVTTINEPNAVGLTVVNGINANGDICGWYTDSNGTFHGFVGLGIVSALRNRHHHHAGPKHALSVSSPGE